MANALLAAARDELHVKPIIDYAAPVAFLYDLLQAFASQVHLHCTLGHTRWNWPFILAAFLCYLAPTFLAIVGIDLFDGFESVPGYDAAQLLALFYLWHRWLHRYFWIFGFVVDDLLFEFLNINFAAHFSVHLLLPACHHFLRQRCHFSLRNIAWLNLR